MPLGFEPNRGQSDSRARFTAKGHGYTLQLDQTGARFQFPEKGKKPSTLRMDLENADGQAAITGERPLPGKANYFPASDPKTWVTNVPSYSRVRYVGVYPGVDVSFYGTANRLEYDFVVCPGADPKQIRMKLSGSPIPGIDSTGDLVVSEGRAPVRFLKPLVYQLASDGKTRELVEARYELEKRPGGEALVTFALGQYDHQRPLIIDPVFDALSYSQFLSYEYVSAVAVDSSGNSYVTGSAYPAANNSGSGDSYYGFYVTKFSPSGAVVYTSTFGTSNSDEVDPLALTVDSTGKAYVAGYLSTSDSILPTTASAFQRNPGASGEEEAFLAVIPATGSAPTYCTYLGGTDGDPSIATGIAVDSTGKVYLSGYTTSITFPTTAGVYQKNLATDSYYTGFVSKFDPTKSGAASLVYSTFLGSPTDTGSSYLWGIAVDSAGDAYVAAQGPPSYPVSSGAFQYTGIESTSGGAYVTELNPTATLPVYSAYLGPGVAYSIAVDGSSSAYVAGTVSYADFPTTAGAYQTDYASGFAVKLNPGGASEAYSTFLSGPSGYDYTAVSTYPTLSLPKGCASSCNAYIAGQTPSSDFPTINAIQSTPTTPAADGSAFIVELNASGTAALFSSYLSGHTTYILAEDGSIYGFTPAVAVDGSGNIYVAGNLDFPGDLPDFPITTGTPTSTSTAFLAKISTTATAGLTLVQPNTVAFGNQPIGVSTSVYNGTATVRLSNYGSTAVTIESIQPSPASLFSESDNCAGTVPAGGYCTLSLNFTPAVTGARGGTVTITSNASNSPITVSLSGTGTDTSFVQASQSSLTFANQAVGTSSAAQTVTITNLGAPSTSLSIYTTAGSGFTTLNNCPPELASGASCIASVTFSPSQPGLLTDTLTISGNGPTDSVSLTGSATVAGVAPVVTFSAASLQFGPQAVSSTSAEQAIYVTNGGSVPIVIQSYTASGDFQVSDYSCGPLPFQLAPQASCYVEVTFSPTTTGARTGNLAITDSASGSPQLVPLSGTGVVSNQNVEFYPSSAISFPDTVVATTAGYQTVYLYNTGTATVTVDRVVVSGDFSLTNNGGTCEATTLAGAPVDGLGLSTGGYCYVYVQFTPTAAGARTGTLTFIDSAPGSPHVVNLSGNGIAATGTIGVFPNAVNFGPQLDGTTSAAQTLYIQNPGNTPVNVTAVTFAGTDPGDYSVAATGCGAPPFLVSAGDSTSCYLEIQFTPGAAGTRGPATLTVASSAGNQTATLTGTGVAASQAIGLTPTSMNLGPIQVGGSGSYEYVYLRNTGTATVTFSANPTITGTNAADFRLSNSCGVSSGQTLAANTSCYIQVYFAPSAVGARSATLTFTDSAGTQTLALSGTGVAATPTLVLSDYLISFDLEAQGTTSAGSSISLTNNGTASLTLGNVAVTAPFKIVPGSDNCSGQPVAASSSCSLSVEFAPTGAGYITGTLTFKNSGGGALSGVPTVPLAGFALGTNSSYLDPTSLNFTAQQVTGTTSAAQTVTLYNTGNVPLNVGTLTGTDFGVAGAHAEFSVAAANGGSDGCSGTSVAGGSSCAIDVTFTPNATGVRPGTVSFPVTYSGGATATLTANLSGTGVAERNSAVLTPPNASFVDQLVNVTSAAVTVILNNSGNQPLNVGTLTNTNATEFSTAPAKGGSDSCSGTPLPIGGSCQITVTFTPSATGARTGSINFPVTFADHTTASPKLTLMGAGISSAKTLQITPGSIQFPAEIQNDTSSYQSIIVSNTGNLPVKIGTDTISLNSTEFKFYSDGCSSTTLAAGSGTCSISVEFKPASSSTGTRTGTLTIADNATGGPHTVALSGVAITAAQQIVLSQTAVAFGNQPAGSTSSTMVVYITNQGDTNVNTTGITLGGTNKADFQVSYTSCYTSYMNPRSSCPISITFAPLATASGALTATVTEVDAVGTHTITLTGTAVVPGPATALTPSTLTFALEDVGSSSAAQNFSVSNTGSANLTITSAASTDAAEFPITLDGCSGAILTPGQNCIVGVKFSPSYGGSRSGTIKITDNASGSPQSLAVSGTGYGIPATSFNPTSLSFGSTNIGVSSATQSVTLSNPGTDTLAIAGITVTGVHAGDFAQTNTCAATLAHGASCVITVKFTPTAAGTRGAYITVADNANNVAGSIQNVALTGTGVSVPNAGVSPTSLTFGSTSIGTPSAAQTVTITNSGTGSLTIASIAIGGANSADYSETNTCGATLVAPPTSSCTISVTFKPSAAGSRTATITITDNANNVTGAQQTVALSGTGVAIPAAALSPTTLTFAGQNVGTTSAAQTVTLSNAGSGALTIASIAFTGSNPGDFSTTNNCAGSVAAGASCSIAVMFSPTASGSRSATLTVTDNANNVSGATQTAAVSGTGVATPAAAVTPPSLTFSSRNVGTTSPAQIVTLSNAGSAALSIASIAVSGANMGDFATITNCGASLARGGSCSIAVTFSPSASGARAATLTVTDNAGNVAGSTQTVSLSGTGVGVPAAAVTPSTLVFGNEDVGVTTAAQSITLGNSGSAALTISSIAISGTNMADFATTNTCAGSVAAGANCTISVTFTPGAPGNRGAILTVTDNANNTAGSTQTVALTGVGIGVPVAAASPSSLTFASTTVGTTAAAQTVTLSNSGTGPLTITSIVIGGTNPGDYAETNTCGASVAVSSSCKISVTFTPTAVGSRTANLHILDNSENVGSTQTVTLSGTGAAAP